MNHCCSHALLHFLLCFCFVLFFDEPKIHKSFILKNFHYSEIPSRFLSSFCNVCFLGPGGAPGKKDDRKEVALFKGTVLHKNIAVIYSRPNMLVVFLFFHQFPQVVNGVLGKKGLTFSFMLLVMPLNHEHFLGTFQSV